MVYIITTKQNVSQHIIISFLASPAHVHEWIYQQKKQTLNKFKQIKMNNMLYTYMMTFSNKKYLEIVQCDTNLVRLLMTKF